MDFCTEWWCLYATIFLYTIYKDITERRISNKTCALFLILGLANMVWMQNYASLIWAVGILLVGFGLTVLGIIAAGDVKLLALLSLAIKPELMGDVLSVIGLLGGVTVLVQWLIGTIQPESRMSLQYGVPYGVPICLGSLLGIYLS
ncbi:A24 family peptidase [Vibrio jasicida]|uniref:A24 family peptidase n=1 Tax=Vibrio jasicida TaxID=766224 RepID=UPI00390B5B4F